MGSERKHGLSTEQFSVSAYVGSSKSLKDLRELGQALLGPRSRGGGVEKREFFIDNLLVRILLIFEIILVDRPCTMGV